MIKKYDDHPKRKELPNKRIGPLDCVRGDVLHFSAVHPGLVFAALKVVFPENNRSVKFFKVPIASLAAPAVIYDMNRPEYAFGENDTDELFDAVDVTQYREVRVVPGPAFDFFNEWKARGERGAPPWGRIPHVFVRGAVDVSGCEVVDWADPV